MNQKERGIMFREIDAIYAELPTIACARKCQEACGPIMMTAPELERVEKRHGGPLHLNMQTLTCPALSAGSCRVYQARPMICRLFGLVKDSVLTCPWGCVPERWLTNAEARGFLDRVEEIAKKYAGTGAMR